MKCALDILLVLIAACVFFIAVSSGEVKSGDINRQVKQEKLTEAQGWALGASALLNERNHASHDTLSVSAMTERNIRDTKRLLSEWWGIENREDLLNMLLKMHLQGHRARFEAIGALLSSLTEEELRLFMEQIKDNSEALNEVRVVNEYYDRLGDKSILGWDFSRYICLCRWGYHVGYLRGATRFSGGLCDMFSYTPVAFPGI